LSLLAPYSPKATRDDKIRHMFQVLDVDEDGFVSEEDIALILRQMAGAGLTEDELQKLVKHVQSAAASSKGLSFAEYKKALDGVDVYLQVKVPVEDD